MFPAKDKVGASGMDTNRFTKQSFDLLDYTHKVAYNNKKKIIEPIEGTDVQLLANTKGRYYLYFWNAGCPGSLSDIHKLDSLSGTGINILIIYLRKNYKAIGHTLGKTHFSQYPYYTIEADKYTNIIAFRQINFIKDACATCYKQYKDDLLAASYILVENGTIRPVFYQDSLNVVTH